MSNKLSVIIVALVLCALICFQSCKNEAETKIATWTQYDEATLLQENANHPSERMRFKLIQSQFADKNKLWAQIEPQIQDFTETLYEQLKPLILERSIREIQSSIASGKLTYKQLTQWYLYRIVKFENDSAIALNNIISVNPDAVKIAQRLDASSIENKHLISGMPILVKDNINTAMLATTAGAVVLANNNTSNAFIIDRIQAHGGIILGKSNLSEWANFLCDGCPNGYSAVGGQTLNPYGPRQFDTGGSSAGSGSAVAANYAVAAVGTETSGSILSPASANSVVGLKPTVGLLSRGGIVPISGTLDTPGPMTKNVEDNAILLSAMVGNDPKDEVTMKSSTSTNYLSGLEKKTLEGLRFGALKSFLTDSLYNLSIEKLRTLGAVVITIEPPSVALNGFLTLLNADMKTDLPAYLSSYGDTTLKISNVADIIRLNLNDSSMSIPYGQARFEGIAAETISTDSLLKLKANLMRAGQKYFTEPMNANNLDGILSINNWSAGYAAVAHFPCVTVPMGYNKGEPYGLTFIAKPFEEAKLLFWAYNYEIASRKRQIPVLYQ